MGDINAAERFWNTLADRDPLWAILSDPTRSDGRWDLETFFRSGEREISTLVYQLDTLLGRFVTARGGVLIFVEDDDRGGQDWTGFRYFVQKPHSQTDPRP